MEETIKQPHTHTAAVNVLGFFFFQSVLITVVPSPDETLPLYS